MVTHAVTKTDSAANEWAIQDDVVHLREWGTDMAHGLPPLPTLGWTVGADETCGLRIEDPSRLVSRQHARLVWGGNKWLLCDGDSKNGLRLDGARRSEIILEPGLEIGIGGVTLIAESRLSIALRGFLARLLGWGSDRIAIVDHALRAVRMAAARRAALVLCGDGDLVPTARSIHRHARGADRPFILCDPRRGRAKETVRAAENYTTGIEALGAATGGSLCVRAHRLPRDFHDLIDVMRAPSSQVQLIACATSSTDCAIYRVMPIEIPDLSARDAEIDRVIAEYAEDARRELQIPPPGFVEADHAWVREHATTLPEIEKATLRLVALRASRNLTNAAARLGMAPVSLSRWIGRRKLPMKLAH